MLSSRRLITNKNKNKNKSNKHKIQTPFGKKEIVYADYAATGLPSKIINDELEKLYPFYANTHSNATLGQKMGEVIENVRNSVRKSFDMPRDSVVLFQGSGASGALALLAHSISEIEDMTVFISEIEHHSNLLPWIKFDPVIVPCTANLLYIDVDAFENALKKCKSKFKIASFCAVSNITGVIQPVSKILETCRKYDCKLILDDAAGAPYINLHFKGHARPDALVFSPHKMAGGQGAPGVLIASPCLFKAREPFVPGGGTVRYVCKEGVEFSKQIETRESGGSPNTLGIARLGLVLNRIKRTPLKSMSKFNIINSYLRKRFQKMEEHIKLIVPGTASIVDRVPIWSFIVAINGKTIHYNLIVALLNDFYGIQTRGGVSCVSLYAQRIFNMKSIKLVELNMLMGDKEKCGEYGWTRISFSPSTPKTTLKFICDAIESLPQLVEKYSKNYSYNCKKNLFSFIKN